jgi:RNA polymerase sigma-70 factor (ECF subfamily)
LEFQTFDETYVRNLTDGCVATERHFVAYFGHLLLIKLRARKLPQHVAEDIRQETFLRVFTTLRRKSGLEHPERLGAFVNSVCNNVLLEYLRSRGYASTADEAVPEPVESRDDAERTLLNKEHKKVVEEVLSELPARDEHILRTVLLDEREKSEVCKDLKVSRENLRVLLHRAKVRFREILLVRYPDGLWAVGQDATAMQRRTQGAS